MIGVAFALIVIGLIILFIVPWVGIVVGVAGLILLVEQCLEVVTIEERLRDIDSLLEAAVTARRQGLGIRCECGAPILWGSHFCANCGRPVGEEPIVSCPNCGNALAADARFCPSCGATAPEEPQAGNGTPADESQGDKGEAQRPGDSQER